MTGEARLFDRVDEVLRGERDASGFITALGCSLCTGDELANFIGREYGVDRTPRFDGFCRQIQKRLEAGE
ncbi:MAG: hypothetical protein ACOY5V_01090 [Pseudomonadota bacterium]